MRGGGRTASMLLILENACLHPMRGAARGWRIESSEKLFEQIF